MTEERLERAKELARAAGKAIGSDARQLGEVPAGGQIPRRSDEQQSLADRAMAVLRDEVTLLARVRAEFAEEKKHGAPASSSPRLDAMAARLEGMTRLALLLDLIAPAEARAIWTEARDSGLHDRPATGRRSAPDNEDSAHGSIEGEH